MYRYVAPALLTLASAAVHTVQVGRAGLVFVPETISAVQGDTIVFELFPGHNVVEGDFESPCQIDDDNFYSGPYSGTDSGAKKFVVNVTSNNPVYYFCSVQRHCHSGSGMVGGINIPFCFLGFFSLIRQRHKCRSQERSSVSISFSCYSVCHRRNR
ncbi:hypothetical protein N0V87_004706 [Didymella glomerata]|uniref:Blue (type 1) copper domain-containing protein n=1 Tax=Didymella glomerata TaxID=749621 RepID=A0A9W9C0G1_9PLEO|nr:hypothetical protein N0V87_004706 [Didymella glomerata]